MATASVNAESVRDENAIVPSTARLHGTTSALRACKQPTTKATKRYSEMDMEYT